MLVLENGRTPPLVGQNLQNATILYFFDSCVQIAWKNRFSGYIGRGVALHWLWPKKAKIGIVVDFDNIVKMGPVGRGVKNDLGFSSVIFLHSLTRGITVSNIVTIYKTLRHSFQLSKLIWAELRSIFTLHYLTYVLVLTGSQVWCIPSLLPDLDMHWETYNGEMFLTLLIFVREFSSLWGATQCVISSWILEVGSGI